MRCCWVPASAWVLAFFAVAIGWVGWMQVDARPPTSPPPLVLHAVVLPQFTTWNETVPEVDRVRFHLTDHMVNYVVARVQEEVKDARVYRGGPDATYVTDGMTFLPSGTPLSHPIVGFWLVVLVTK